MAYDHVIFQRTHAKEGTTLNLIAGTTDDMNHYLIDLWREEYISQLHIFLAWYRDYLLRLLATWFDSFGVPRRNDRDDNPSGLPFRPGPTGVPRITNAS